MADDIQLVATRGAEEVLAPATRIILEALAANDDMPALASAAGLGPGDNPTFAGLGQIGVSPGRSMAVAANGRATWTYGDNAVAIVNTLVNDGMTAVGHGIGWSVRLGRSPAGTVTAGWLTLESTGDYLSTAGQSSRWVLRAQVAGALVPVLTLDPVNGITFGAQVDLPAGSTIGGQPIGSGEGSNFGNLVTLPGNPTTADLPAGKFMVAKNAGTGRRSLWVNDGGTIVDLLDLAIA